MRHDHTSWLIHFVRNRIPEQDFPGESEVECEYFVNEELECDADAFQVLRTIVRLGGLYPGYSFRSGRTTIYGGKPAVCVTEMPLYSFASYVSERGNAGCVSAYGIAFLKSELFEAGGRPVIYGLSSEMLEYDENTPCRRVFKESVLPISEQYRYVAYNPSGDKWIDWSHEREWRWVPKDAEKDTVCGLRGDGTFDANPGLPLFLGKENDGYFSKLCIIVWTEEEARKIQELLTGLYFSGANDYDTPFSRALILNSFIIVLEKVVSQVEIEHNLNAQTIEGLQEADLTTTIITTNPPYNAKELINTAIKKAKEAGKKAAEEYKDTHDDFGVYCGFASVVTHEISNPLVQYMLKEGIATAFDGYICITVYGDWDSSPSMDYQEYIYTAVANSLQNELGFDAYMISRPD